MAGEPLAQAKAVARALVESLDDRDRLELIQFSSRPRRWRRGDEPATETARRDALAWLDALVAEGGTEMREGIVERLRMRRNTFLQNITRARRLLADCLRRRGIDLAVELP